MTVKLFDSELKVMDVLWREGEVPARAVVDELAQTMGYKSSTTYTLITRCIAKGAIERVEPGYRCRALIAQDDVQASETDEFIDRIFNGSVDKLFSSLIKRKKISAQEFARLSALIDEAEAEATSAEPPDQGQEASS